MTDHIPTDPRCSTLCAPGESCSITVNGQCDARPGTVVAERLRALGRQLGTGGDYRIDAAAALIDDMVTVLEADAEACAGCHGEGVRHVIDAYNPDGSVDEPCADCAEIWALIARAEART